MKKISSLQVHFIIIVYNCIKSHLEKAGSSRNLNNEAGESPNSAIAPQQTE